MIYYTVDESKIAKRKYNKGHKVEGAWVIGGFERSTVAPKTVPVFASFEFSMIFRYNEYI